MKTETSAYIVLVRGSLQGLCLTDRQAISLSEMIKSKMPEEDAKAIEIKPVRITIRPIAEN